MLPNPTPKGPSTIIVGICASKVYAIPVLGPFGYKPQALLDLLWVQGFRAEFPGFGYGLYRRARGPRVC